ncbi:hypothetical protein Sjap_001756 [Stephania japonica]|uniref:Uncharacterized protein n=1 Tax=Stephania japonica TaxID=461633 RepID=A0AAP0KKQ2_9MAGN
MKIAGKAVVLPYAERCKNILVSNWRGALHTIKADAKGSKGDIYSSKVKYFFNKGKPYVWVLEGDKHNVNTVIDERGSLSVTSVFPGPLASLLKSINKLPSRIALTGDVIPLRHEKAHIVAENLRETILTEEKTLKQSSYSVSGIFASSVGCSSRGESLQEVLDGGHRYATYKFDIRSCTYIDNGGSEHEVDVAEIKASKADQLSPYVVKLIDGINQNRARRRALMLFCLVHMNTKAKDAFMLSVDRKGFNVLGKVPRLVTTEGLGDHQWREFRFTFTEEASDIETFCHLLVEMEEEALKTVSSYSGLTF